MQEDQLPCGYVDIPTYNPPQQQKQYACSKISSECCQGDCQVKQQSNSSTMNKNKLTKVCYKCRINLGAIIHKSQPMCKECALRNVEYKCRVNLQNKIKIKGTDKLLVCVSGGMNSICLINILKQLQTKFQKHLLFASFELIHIDLSPLCEIDKKEKYLQNLSKLKEFSTKINSKLNIVSILDIYGNEYKQNEQKILKLMKGFNSAANHADIIEIFINRLINKFNQKENKLIVKGTIGQKIASNIFKYLIKGKGQNLDELNWRNENTIFPLRQHLTKQVQYYYYHKKLQEYSFPQVSLHNTVKNTTNQIDNILQDFMDTIQDTYSHTCPTILRTSQKIKSLNDKKKQCKWCLSNCQEFMCLRCERILQNWKEKSPINNYLPVQFHVT